MMVSATILATAREGFSCSGGWFQLQLEMFSAIVVDGFSCNWGRRGGLATVGDVFFSLLYRIR